MRLLRFLGRLLFALAWTALVAAVGFWLAHVISQLPHEPWPVMAFWIVVGAIFAFAALRSVLQAPPAGWLTGRNGPTVLRCGGGGGAGGGGDGGGGYGG